MSRAMEDPVTQPTAPRDDFWRFSAELIKTAIIVSVLAYVIRLFILQPFIVEGSSMYPQFQTQDYLLVDKVSYRLHQPERGDIIVFRYPNDLSINYVKRVIGLPGEKVVIEDGIVTVFPTVTDKGIVLEEKYIPSENSTRLPSGASRAEFLVPKDQYFVLGDNRQASSDSREWGFLPKEDLIGRVVVQAFPLNRAAVIPHARY